jgi:signal transduction histidine kinase
MTHMLFTRFGLFWKRSIVVFSVVLALLGAGVPALASPYGEGSYGACPYQSCATPVPTTISTPTGLQVSINLSNGQVIPLSGFTIIIAPLNGNGGTFREAAIFINGTLGQTVEPGSSGVATWRWKPSAAGAVSVKIVITDAVGASTTHTFSVTVRASTGPGLGTNTVPAVKPGLVSRAVNHAANFVRSLPKPVVRGVPYLLFALLAVDALLVALGAGREVRELRTLQVLITRMRQVDQEKQSFIELASHYLRTPLTGMLGGVELLRGSDPVPAPSMQAMQTVARDMQVRVEALLQETHRLADTDADLHASMPLALRRRAGWLVPIVLIGSLWLGFSYLATRAGTLAPDQVERTIQIIAFTVIATLIYLATRYRQLRRLDTAQLRMVVGRQAGVARARDHLVATANDALGSDMKQLSVLVADSVQLQPRDFIQHSIEEMDAILSKLAVAEELHGTRTPNGPVAVELRDIYRRAAEPLDSKIRQKHISVECVESPAFATPEPDLLVTVLSSLLDNAVEHSADGGRVEVHAKLIAEGIVITVADEGEGIAADKLPLLLQPFSRAENVENFTHAGMGFSLYLDKLILSYLGGNISLDSTQGKGTTVTVYLPDGTATRDTLNEILHR